MTFPAHTNADPDPTTQIAWPAKKTKRTRTNSLERPSDLAESSGASNAGNANVKKEVVATGRRMSTMDLIKMSISMAGAQVAWTVELGCVSGTHA